MSDEAVTVLNGHLPVAELSLLAGEDSFTGA
jgi:hypothetical protein